MKTELATFQDVVLPRRNARQAAGLPLPLGMALFGCAPGALELLRQLAIAVIGCGSVGGRIALLLARMGLGRLLLVDPKSCKAGSLATHDIGPEEVGQPKALVAARRCKSISPASRVSAFVGPVEALELADLADAGLVVMAPDLLSVEVEMGQRGLWLGTPLVQASVHGPTLTLHVRFFLNANAAGACPACLYGQREWELLSRQVRFSCEGASGAAPPSPAAAPATNSLCALCALAADLAVIQILRFFLKLGQPVADTMLEYCAFTHKTILSPIARNPRCKLDHTTFTQAAVAVPLAGLSLAQVTQTVTGAPVPANAQFEVAGLDWVELGACRCPQHTPVRQFVPRGCTKLSLCPRCVTPVVPLSFYAHRAVSALVLGSAIEQPLKRLGARRVSSLLIRTGDTGTLVRSQPSPPASS